MRYSIVGSSIAAKAALETLLPRIDEEDSITIVTPEKTLFYSRVLLPDYIAGKLPFQGLTLKAGHLLNDSRIRIRRGTVSEIHPGRKTLGIETEKGARTEVMGFDACIICMGASAVLSDIPGARKGKVSALRTLDDAERIIETAHGAGNSIILGGGLVSLKAAWALRELGKKVTVAVASSSILSRVADEYTSKMIRSSFEQAGVKILLGLSAESMDIPGEVTFRDGSKVPADMAVIGKGVTPNTGPAEKGGLSIDRGILADRRMESSAEDIYVAGDVAQGPHMYHGGKELITLWPEAYFHGKTAALNAAGEKTVYSGGFRMNSVCFYGIPYIFYGDVLECDVEDGEVHTRIDEIGKTYRKIILREGRIVGAILAGDIRMAGVIYWAMRTRRVVEKPETYLHLKGLYSLCEEYEKHRSINYTFMTNGR